MKQIEISAATSIVVLTGAGISQESGLDTFRDAGGIWARYDIDDVATRKAFTATRRWYTIFTTNSAGRRPPPAPTRRT